MRNCENYIETMGNKVMERIWMA